MGEQFGGEPPDMSAAVTWFGMELFEEQCKVHRAGNAAQIAPPKEAYEIAC